MKKTLLKNARLINEGKQWEGDLLMEGERIAKIAKFYYFRYRHSHRH